MDIPPSRSSIPIVTGFEPTPQTPGQPEAGGRSSIAARLRGWSGDTTGLEQRLKDHETFARSHRRRWILIAVGALLGLIGAFGGTVPTQPGTIVLTSGAFATLNVLIGLMHERGWYRWWLIYALALVDVVFVATLVLWFGHGGMVVAFFIAVLPYAFDQSSGVGDFLVLMASLAYLSASYAHGQLYRGSPGLDAGTFIETVVFILTAVSLKRIPATLIERIRHARGVMGEAEHGFLAVRAPAAESDELGFLEQSFNRMLDEIGATISSVQREADEVAAFAEQLAASAEQLHSTSEMVTHTAQDLAEGLGHQRELAESARGESAKASDQASALRTRAEMMQVDARRLVNAAERGRERVARASQTLRTVGEEVRATAATVAGLSGMSDRIGGFAQAIARIARSTHLLALNAAIEAARAEERGEGFAVVADEVRALAAEAARSAREVAELVTELRVGIDAAARAMQTGETQVRDIGAVAAEADGALQELHQGVQLIGDLVNATADVSRSQAGRLADLAQSLQQVASISSSSSVSADQAASSTRSQIGSMSDLSATSQQLAQLAERLRASIARFSVLRPDQVTAEHRAVTSEYRAAPVQTTGL
jgi:methyl-accepting chemotaxis protein